MFPLRRSIIIIIIIFSFFRSNNERGRKEDNESTNYTKLHARRVRFNFVASRSPLVPRSHRDIFTWTRMTWNPRASRPFARTIFSSHVFLLGSPPLSPTYIPFLRLVTSPPLRFTKHKVEGTPFLRRNSSCQTECPTKGRSQPTNFTSNKWLWSAAHCQSLWDFVVNGDNLEQRHCAFPWRAIYCRLYYERPYQTLLRTVVAAGMQLAPRVRKGRKWKRWGEEQRLAEPYRTVRACVSTFLNSMQILTACSVNVIILLNISSHSHRLYIYMYKFNIFLY